MNDISAFAVKAVTPTQSVYDTMEHFQKISEEILSTPSLSTCIGFSENSALTIWTQPDLPSNKPLLTARSLVDGKLGFPIGSLAKAFTGTSTGFASIRELGNDFVIELFSTDRRVWYLKTQPTQHGGIFFDEHFGSFSVSPGSKYISYVAGKPKEKEETFEYAESWGERYVELGLPKLVIVDVEAKTIEQISTEFDVAQPQWISDSELVCTTYHPPRMGAAFCTNRNTRLAKFSVARKTFDFLDVKARLPRSPRPHGSKVAFLARESTSAQLALPHHAEAMLCILDLENGEIEDIEEVFLQNLVQRPWTSTGQLVWTTYDGSKSVSWQGTSRKSAKFLGPGVVLDVFGERVFLKQSTPVQPDSLVGMQLDGPTTVWGAAPTPAVLGAASATVFNLDRRNGEGSFNGFMLLPEKPRHHLVAFPHGGPHSHTPFEWEKHSAFLCSLGYHVLLVNFTGSTGMLGSVAKLAGRYGTLDVEDCEDAIAYAQKTYNCDRVFLFGGSHGGFLIGHLIARAQYAAASVRNPVIDMESMLSTTDIPDWLAVSVGISPSLSHADIRRHLAAVSPLNRLQEALYPLPVIIHLGAKDKRVPPESSYILRKTLLDGECQVKMMVYPDDNHSLLAPKVEHTVMTTTAEFFEGL